MLADAITNIDGAQIKVSAAVTSVDIAPAANVNPIDFLKATKYTSLQPACLTKIVGLNPVGDMKKDSAASIFEGTAECVSIANLREFAYLLDSLTDAQAVGFGIAGEKKVSIVTDANDTGCNALEISRTRRNFSFAKQPGIMMLDHDGMPGVTLDRDAFRRRLIEVCPALETAPMLWRPSASAGILRPDGSELTGLDRHRLYIAVKEAALIPDAGRRLVTKLWAAGVGWHEIGKAGQALRRTIVDAAVWQPERLDFAAPPILLDGLRRVAVTSHFYCDEAPPFDLAAIIVSSAEEKAAAKHVQESRASVRLECKAKREAWAAERAPSLAQSLGLSKEKALGILIRASEHSVLMGDFALISSEGSSVRVGELLDEPDKWHEARFADPLDPDQDRRVAVANLKSGGQPFIYTHRHGGMRFELQRQSVRVQVGQGLQIATTDAVLAVLRERGELFDFGEGGMVYVAAGRTRTVNQEWLADHMGRVCGFYMRKPRTGPEGEPMAIEVAVDAPLKVARAILAKNGERGFRRLQAVITGPTLRADGSVLDVPGYDADSGLLYFSGHPSPPRVPENPTPVEALEALKLLWQPMAKFPLVDDVARGVVLHGLLTAALRAALPTAPGIALDAPAAGTGKTLLARCIGILASGAEPAVLPPADDDAETRKRLFAALREGSRVLLWDNVREPLGCAALDSFLTAATFQDRILGSSETASLPNRAMFIATGNNLRLTGDTCRRIFLARLDAESETPYARDFDFCPAQRLEADRLRYLVAALTIVRAYISAGKPKVGAGRTASFEVWDDLVRQPICWLKGLVEQAGRDDLPSLDDPLNAAEQAFSQDPETTKHAALMHAWSAAFDSTPTTVARAVLCGQADDDLMAALDEIGGQGQKINGRMIGRWIERHVGRRIRGLRFERAGMRSGVTQWAVKHDSPATSDKPTKPTKPTKQSGSEKQPLRSDGGISGSGGFVSDRSVPAMLAQIQPTVDSHHEVQ